MMYDAIQEAFDRQYQKKKRRWDVTLTITRD